jgi:hypothetical protein
MIGMKQIAKDVPHGADKQCKSSIHDYARQKKQTNNQSFLLLNKYQLPKP